MTGFIVIIILVTVALSLALWFCDYTHYTNLTVILGSRFFPNIVSQEKKATKSIAKSYIYNGRKVKTSYRNIGIVYDDGLSAYNIKRGNLAFWKEGRQSLYTLDNHIGDFVIVSPLKVEENPFRSSANLFQGKYIRKLVGMYETLPDENEDKKALSQFIRDLLDKWKDGDYRYNMNERTYSLSIEQQYNELREAYPEETEFAVLYSRESCTAGSFDVTPVSGITGIVEFIQK